ncbi:hypothetical protein AVEN_151107-1 [Araneus ventricosus]|uniref:C2H2-type domain-containing protein n=1 Tax=Araneus ventricosus TaxID=182803 RepID=A0A4Y2Q3C7_ARAVE|nr:hypothetical protein AVEN_151107-1 [Araneus ventricosus]
MALLAWRETWQFSDIIERRELRRLGTELTDQDLLTLNPSEEETRELEGATPLNELRDLFPLARWQPDIASINPTVIIQQHQSEDPNTFCTECDIELNEEDAYARHRMRVHGDLSSSAPFNPVYMCHACSQSFPTLQGKRSHSCPKSKPYKFKCNMCIRDCRTAKGLREHQQRVRGTHYSTSTINRSVLSKNSRITNSLENPLDTIQYPTITTLTRLESLVKLLLSLSSHHGRNLTRSSASSSRRCNLP